MKLLEGLKNKLEGYLISKGLAKGVKAIVAALMGLIGAQMTNPAVVEVLEKAKGFGIEIHLDNGQLEQGLAVLLTGLGGMLVNFLMRKKK